MIQKVVRHDEVVDEVAARIAEAVLPWRIVLFGSRARGDSREDSDYDLLIEIDSSATPRIEIERQIRELFLGRAFRVDVKLRGPGEIERRRDDPGALEWDVAREGRVLYADPEAPTNLMRADRVREPPVEPPESVREWLDSAERDLRMCRFHVELADDSWDFVCFWAQQTVEKHMKPLLVSRRVRPDRTHDLPDLLLRRSRLASNPPIHQSTNPPIQRSADTQSITSNACESCTASACPPGRTNAAFVEVTSHLSPR